MKVDSLEGSSAIRKIKSKRHKSSDIFSINVNSDEEGEVESSLPSSSIPNLNPFLALQEVDTNFPKDDKEALSSEGGMLIENLNELRLALVNDDLREDNIQKLKNIIEQQNKYKFNNKDAQDIYDEIYLRASVELAKLELIKTKK